MANPLETDLEQILERAAADLHAIKGKEIFITGGTGFFGLWLLETLSYANEKLGLEVQATVLSRSPEALKKNTAHLFDNEAFRFVAGDIRNFDFPQGDFDLFIHGATTTARETFNNEDPRRKFETVAHGTKRMLEFASQQQPEKILYLGSGACYGLQPADMQRIEESYDGAPEIDAPNSALGLGKRAAEDYCHQYADNHNLDISIARCFTFYGPYLPIDIHYAIGNFVADGLAGRAIEIKGDGTPVRSYLYIADLIVWLLAILVRGQRGEAYNVGSESELTIAELANQVGDQFGVPVSILGERGYGPVSRYIPSTEKARSHMNLSEWTSMQVGLDRMANHIRRLPGFY